MLASCLIHYNVVIGNGRGGESIYGGFFEGKAATVRIVRCDQWHIASRWQYNLMLFPPR